MHVRPSVLRAALLGPLLIVTVACSGGGDDVADPTAETLETVAATDALFTRNSDDDGSGEAVSTPTTGDAEESSDTNPTVAEPAEPADSEPATSPPTVPDTGVPGIDSEDEFCRSWSEFAGSFQALAGAWAIGDPTEAARSETAASDVVLGAATGLDAHLPSDLESERAAVVALVDPLSRRSQAARDELMAAAISSDGIEALGAAWLDALIEFGVDDPTIAIAVPPEVDAETFGAAAASFAAAKPSIVEDPSLIVDVEIPLTEQYLIANCPDQGTLGGNDDIGS